MSYEIEFKMIEIKDLSRIQKRKMVKVYRHEKKNFIQVK